MLARRDAELLEPRLVDDEGRRVADDDEFRPGPALGHPEPEPDPDHCKAQRDEAALDREPLLDDEETVLEELEAGDEEAAKEAVRETLRCTWVSQ